MVEEEAESKNRRRTGRVLGCRSQQIRYAAQGMEVTSGGDFRLHGASISLVKQRPKPRRYLGSRSGLGVVSGGNGRLLPIVRFQLPVPPPLWRRCLFASDTLATSCSSTLPPEHFPAPDICRTRRPPSSSTATMADVQTIRFRRPTNQPKEAAAEPPKRINRHAGILQDQLRR